MRNTAALLIACGALTLSACSSDDNGVVVTEPDSTEATTASYTVTFTNLSSGQPMTPPVVAIHDDAINLFETGAAATAEVQAIAETGNNDPLVALATSLMGAEVSAAGVAGNAPFGPGATASVTLENGLSTHVLSAVSMVICTNDGFTGLDSVALPTDASPVTLTAVPYDAGTEVNNLDPTYWVAPPAPCGNPGTENLREDEGGVIAAHPGQTGVGAFDFAGADNIMQIEITRVEVPVPTANFAVTLTNLSAGQPMTPAVVAIHDDAVNLFETGTAASTQLQAIAEDGNNDPMVALAGSLGEQVSVAGVIGDAPLPPSGTATLTLENGSTDHVLSLVNMVICTNDGFTGLDSVPLPTDSTPVTLTAVPYDAGTEVNNLDPSYWVAPPAPCGNPGTENMREAEAGVITAHPGQTGVGAFDFAGTDNILQIEITRQ